MILLLDTHAFLWFVTDDAQLSIQAKTAIADADNKILTSPASHWKVAIKVSIDKYPLSSPYETFITQGIHGNSFRILPIEPKHTAVVATPPFHHRDPFDRLIIAQAIVEGISVVSNDAVFDAYSVTRLW